MVGVTLAIAMGCSRTEREDLVVAKVDTRTVTVREFETTAETLDNKYLPETNDMEGKKELLRHMVNKEVMTLKAYALGYQREDAFQSFWEQFKGPFLITALWNEEITKKVEVTEEETDFYWEQMHYEYTLAQILVANENEALEIRQKIVEEGEDFAEMAKRYSLGPEGENGGNVGSESVGRIHWWVEEVLFDMEVGDVSPPVMTDNGWGLLKVLKKRKILPDKDREYAGKRVRAIKEYKGRNLLKEQIERDIHLQIYSDAVDIAYDHLPEDVPFEEFINGRVTRENAPRVEIPDKYRELIICQYDDGIYTLADFEELYSMTALPDRPRHSTGKYSIIQLLKKVIYDRILPVYAEEVAKVLEVPEVKENYEKRLEQFLVYRLYQDQIQDEISVTEREIREEYEESREMFRTKEKRNYQIIVLEDEATANMVAQKARAKESFDLLTRKYSKDPTVKDNMGKTGLIPSGNYLEYDGVAFALPAVGSISDPFEMSRGWAVIKVLEIEPGGIPTFEEAESAIKKQLMEKKGSELLDKKMEDWRETYVIEIYEKNLEKAKMNRTRL